MSSQDNWNNPDMYYQQPQPGPAAGNGYGGSNANYSAASYNSNSAYAPGSQYVAGAPGYAYQPLPPNNTLAIIALVASIVGATSFFPAGIAGIIMGHISAKQIRTRGDRGAGMASAALWVGYISTAFWLIVWALIILFYFGLFALILATENGAS